MLASMISIVLPGLHPNFLFILFFGGNTAGNVECSLLVSSVLSNYSYQFLGTIQDQTQIGCFQGKNPICYTIVLSLNSLFKAAKHTLSTLIILPNYMLSSFENCFSKIQTDYLNGIWYFSHKYLFCTFYLNQSYNLEQVYRIYLNQNRQVSLPPASYGV